MRVRMSLRLFIVVGSAVSTVSTLLIGAASPTFAAQTKNASRPATVTSCRPSDLSATLALTGLGNSPSTLAGAVLFSKTSHGACSLKGVPAVSVVSASGQAISVAQAPMTLHHIKSVTLSSSPSSAVAGTVGSSITWSGWGCPTGSFAIVVRFSGWTQPLTVPYGATSGYAGRPCTGAGAVIYVGPVGRAATAA
jgi:hypothetical protein